MPPRGLPGALPEGETLLWQGSPSWRSLARHCCHMPAFCVYFAILLGWSAIDSDWGGAALPASLHSLARLLGLALVALLLLGVFAKLVERSTIYSITNRRVVLGFGIAMPMTITIPFGLIDTAGLRRHRDGSGDVVLTLSPGVRRAPYVVLWPHARPWRLVRAEPMLRGVPEAAAAAQVLARALAAAAEQPALAVPVAEDAVMAGQRPRAAAAA